MSVYFLEAIGMDLVKIGSTNRVTQRYLTLRSASPVEVRMLKVTKGTRRHELEFHRQFAQHRVRFEWFRLFSIKGVILALPDEDPDLCDRIPRSLKSLKEVRKLVAHLISQTDSFEEKERIRDHWMDWKKGWKITELDQAWFEEIDLRP